MSTVERNLHKEIAAAHETGNVALQNALLLEIARNALLRLQRRAALGGCPQREGVAVSPKTKEKLDAAESRWTARVLSDAQALMRRCESPVERMFLWAALNHAGSDVWTSGARARFCNASGLLVACEVLDGAAMLALQVKAEDYRIDFAIVPETGQPGLAIEVDGHEYHETKQAAARDKRRDRALAAAGWTVVRFAAVEVWRDADKCFAEALDVFQGRAR